MSRPHDSNASLPGDWLACTTGVPLWAAELDLPDDAALPADASVESMDLARSRHRRRRAQRSRELDSQTGSLKEWSDRVHSSLGLPPEHEITWRLIEYLPGQGHDAHDDLYADDTGVAVASVLVCLRAPATGGETVFGPDGEPGLMVRHRRGQALYWHNVDEDGAPVAAVRHRAVPVGAGLKTVALGVVWSREAKSPPSPPSTCGADARPATVREVLVGRPAIADVDPGAEMTGLFLVMDGATDSTRLAYQAACALRRVPFWPLDVDRLHDLSVSLPAGAMLLTTGSTLRCQRVEQALEHPGLVRLTREPVVGSASLMPLGCRRAWTLNELPVIPSVPLVNAVAPALHRAVEVVGGLPALVEFSSTGAQPTRVRVDSVAGLHSVVEHGHACGDTMDVLALREKATRWEVVVVDGEVIGALQSSIDSGSALGTTRAVPPTEVATAAIAGSTALGVPAGLVEIWSSAHGAELVALRFPFDVDRLQDHGVDAAGALVRALMKRASGAG